MLEKDWVFGTVENRKKAKTKNLIKGYRCSSCISQHFDNDARQPNVTWCRKKSDRPEGGVCEWWDDGTALQTSKTETVSTSFLDLQENDDHEYIIKEIKPHYPKK